MHYEKERTSVSPVTTLGFKLWPDSETELPGRRSLTGRASAGIVTIKVTVFGHSWGILGLSATGKKALTQEWSLSAIRVGLFLTELKASFISMVRILCLSVLSSRFLYVHTFQCFATAFRRTFVKYLWRVELQFDRSSKNMCNLYETEA